MEANNQAISIMAGLAVLGLIVAGAYSIPAWMPLLATLIIASMLTGFDDSVVNQQLERRHAAEQLEEQYKRSPVGENEQNVSYERRKAHDRYTKNRLLEQQPERIELLKELEVTGVDVDKFTGMTVKQIYKKLTKKQATELESLRSFTK